LTFAARLRRSLVLLSAIGLVGAFWIVSPFLPANEQSEWLRVFLIVVSGTAILVNLRSFWAIILRPSPINAQQYVIGTQLILLGLFIGGLWLLLWRMAAFPAWMIASRMNGFLLYVSGLGVLFFVMAVKREGDGPSRTDWRRVAIVFILTLVLGYAVVHVRPDVRPVVDWLRLRVSSLTRPPRNVGDPPSKHRSVTVNAAPDPQ
jgi:hypothetical protein